jgi:serine/threonine protein kinase
MPFECVSVAAAAAAAAAAVSLPLQALLKWCDLDSGYVDCHTLLSSALGTPPWHAPEVRARYNKKGVDRDLVSSPEADVWSLGLMLFSMLMGALPKGLRDADLPVSL